MEYRQLGRSGLRISTLTLGAATFGGRGALGVWGDTDVDGARCLIDRSLDAGVNLIDTANIYSNGLSEEIVGEALEGGRRERILVATKVRLPMGRGPNDSGSSPCRARCVSVRVSTSSAPRVTAAAASVGENRRTPRRLAASTSSTPIRVDYPRQGPGGHGGHPRGASSGRCKIKACRTANSYSREQTHRIR